jgi:hypothetical protein
MVDIPREMASDPAARAAWEAASPEERLRSVKSIAEMVEEDRADPDTPDDFDVPLEGVDPPELPAVSGGGPAKVGQSWNVEAMTKVAALLRAWGWPVLGASGWQTRGVGTLRANTIGCHHTGATVDIDRMLMNGRPDLGGPLCNFALHRDGTIVLIAAGTANHFGVASVPNSQAWGIEATGPIPLSNVGIDAFPNYLAYTALCTAIRLVEGWGVGTIKAHKEVALPDGRKIDPAFGDPYPKPYHDMDRFRLSCSGTRVLKSGTVTPPQEEDEMTPADRDWMLRALLAAQTGKGNTMVTTAQAAMFKGSCQTQLYELTAYGDTRLEADTPEGHPNSIQRTRYEIAKIAAGEAARDAALKLAVEAMSPGMDLTALKASMEAAAKEGAAAALAEFKFPAPVPIEPPPGV